MPLTSVCQAADLAARGAIRRCRLYRRMALTDLNKRIKILCPQPGKIGITCCLPIMRSLQSWRDCSKKAEFAALVDLLVARFGPTVAQQPGAPAFVAEPGQVFASCLNRNAFHPRKGKPAERRGRKAMGLRSCEPGEQTAQPMVARLPKGWAGEEPVRPRALVSRKGKHESPHDSGAGHPATRRLALLFSISRTPRRTSPARNTTVWSSR